MLEDFLSYIVEELSVLNTDKLLLAVSGGMDSMVMLDLFRQTKYTIAVAHVNHSTRNGESDHDELFLKKYCTTHKIKFYTKKLDFQKLANGNFQQNARIARYAFFNQLMSDNKFDYLATAHHMDDRWETFIMNLNRKSGIHGLTSLKSETNQIIRPLLRFSRSAIEAHCATNAIEYKEDSSNSSDDYTRNKIRHHISKKVEEVLPVLIKNANDSILKLENTQKLLGELIQSSNFITQDEISKYYKVELDRVKSFINYKALAYEIFRPFEFSYSDILDMTSTQQTGSIFLSKSHQALYDRGTIILRPLQEITTTKIVIESFGTYLLADGRNISYRWLENKTSNESMLLSYDKLEGKTLIIRSVLPGDYFHPAGMKGKRKTLKKFFNDLKLNKFEREKQLVLEVDKEIALIIGHRVSEHFKATTNSLNVMISIQ